MRLNQFIQGLKILLPHYNQPDGYHLGADHDVIYLYATDTPLSPEEFEKMNELGFFQDISQDEYDPNESWMAYI